MKNNWFRGSGRNAWQSITFGFQWVRVVRVGSRKRVSVGSEFRLSAVFNYFSVLSRCNIKKSELGELSMIFTTWPIQIPHSHLQWRLISWATASWATLFWFSPQNDFIDYFTTHLKKTISWAIKQYTRIFKKNILKNLMNSY